MRTQTITFEALAKLLDLPDTITSVEVTHSRGLVHVHYLSAPITREGQTFVSDEMICINDVMAGGGLLR